MQVCIELQQVVWCARQRRCEVTDVSKAYMAVGGELQKHEVTQSTVRKRERGHASKQRNEAKVCEEGVALDQT